MKMLNTNFLDIIRSKIAISGSDSLYENSFFIFLGRSLAAFCGLIFWTLATRYYSPTDIGIATALISSLGLVVTFSKLGFDVSLIKFMPVLDRTKVFNSCLFIISTSSILASLIFLMSVDYIAPQISFIKKYTIYFIIFVFLSSITFTTGTAFISIRKGKYYFLQSAIESIRVPLLIPFAMLGSLGIFFSQGVSIVLSSAVALSFIRKFVDIRFKFDCNFIKNSYKLSIVNYISNIFVDAPTFVMPILILNLLGPKNVSLYFIASTLGTSIYLLLPDAICRSFFVEGSHGLDMRTGLIKSLTLAYIVLVLEFIFIFFMGSYLLGMLGRIYLEAAPLLNIYIVVGFFSIIYMIFMPIMNLKMLYLHNIELNFLRFIFLLIFSYIFVSKFGLIGTGYAWALTEIITCSLIFFWVKTGNIDIEL